jgi:hypothetical protein
MGRHRNSHPTPKMNNFCRSYAETALWSSNDESDESGGEPLDKNYDVSDIAPATIAQMIKDCKDFEEANEDDLDATGLSEERLGHNFWLSRNGHGAGFFDDVFGELGDKLQRAAKVYGTVDLYVGDDGRIHG